MMKEFKVVKRTKDVHEPNFEVAYGICYAESFPFRWSETGLAGTFEECLEKCREILGRNENPGVVLFDSEEFLTGTFATAEQIVIVVAAEGLGEKLYEREWKYEQKPFAVTLQGLQSWRGKYGSGATHGVMRRISYGWMTHFFGEPSLYEFASLAPIPDGHGILRAGSEQECRAIIEKIKESMKNPPDDDEMSGIMIL